MLTTILELVKSEPWQVLVEVLAIWIGIYLIYRFLRGTRGAGAIKGFAVILVVATFLIRIVGQQTDAFERLNFLYSRFLGLVAVMLIVVFQPELRQAMIRIGHAWTFGGRQTAARGVADVVAEACGFLSKAQFGALIAIERRSRLGGLVETGIELDARVSASLLESIFYPNSPLHDLGVVIRGDRILAATVQFPLAEEGVLPNQYGSRHRAAVGLSAETDCVVVIVSEETGKISIAENGRLDAGIERDALAEELVRRLAADPTSADEDDRPDDSADAGSGSESGSGSGPESDADASPASDDASGDDSASTDDPAASPSADRPGAGDRAARTDAAPDRGPAAGPGLAMGGAS